MSLVRRKLIRLALLEKVSASDPAKPYAQALAEIDKEMEAKFGPDIMTKLRYRDEGGGMDKAIADAERRFAESQAKRGFLSRMFGAKPGPNDYLDTMSGDERWGPQASPEARKHLAKLLNQAETSVRDQTGFSFQDAFYNPDYMSKGYEDPSIYDPINKWEWYKNVAEGVGGNIPYKNYIV